MADIGSSAYIGNLALLDGPLLALFCSRRCPGNVILRAYDLAVALRDAGVPVIGGFHTPVERELLRVLLRGSAPIVIVEARGRRTKETQAFRDLRPHIDAERLLVLWPFPDEVARMTRTTATTRNRVVLKHAARVLILHANPGGETAATAEAVAQTGKPLATLALDDDANANLLALGATTIHAHDAGHVFAQ